MGRWPSHAFAVFRNLLKASVVLHLLDELTAVLRSIGSLYCYHPGLWRIVRTPFLSIHSNGGNPRRLQTLPRSYFRIRCWSSKSVGRGLACSLRNSVIHLTSMAHTIVWRRSAYLRLTLHPTGAIEIRKADCGSMAAILYQAERSDSYRRRVGGRAVQVQLVLDESPENKLLLQIISAGPTIPEVFGHKTMHACHSSRLVDLPTTGPGGRGLKKRKGRDSALRRLGLLARYRKLIIQSGHSMLQRLRRPGVQYSQRVRSKPCSFHSRPCWVVHSRGFCLVGRLCPTNDVLIDGLRYSNTRMLKASICSREIPRLRLEVRQKDHTWILVRWLSSQGNGGVG